MDMSSTYASVLQRQDYSSMFIINETFFNTSSYLTVRLNDTKFIDKNVTSTTVRDPRYVDFIPGMNKAIYNEYSYTLLVNIT